MKYCYRPFEYLYLDHYNGDVYLCPWMEPNITAIGNLLEEDLDTIWHGEKAEALRETARNGSYAHCRIVACPRLQNQELPDEPEGTDAWKCSDSPQFINLAFDFVCNQSCPTCRNEVFVPDEDYQNKVNKIVERILPHINKAKELSASGHGDPFASPYMMKILENLHPENKDFHLLLETNGVFFDEEHWHRIEHLQDCNTEIVVTTNSYTPAIYEAISRHGNLDKLKKNQLFMRKLREEGKLSHTTNCMVVQERNFHEIPDFIRTSLNVYGFDNVVLKPVYNWGNLTEEEYWFKDVLNPLHPYHEQYKKIIEQPIVRDNPRVYNFGGEMDHEPKPMPGKGTPEYQKLAGYFEMFKAWLKRDDNRQTFRDFVQKSGAQNVLIYGAGDVGQAVARMLAGNPHFHGYVDQFRQECEVGGISLHPLYSDAVRQADLVFVTPVHVFCDIERDLRGAGCQGQIVCLTDVLAGAC